MKKIIVIFLSVAYLVLSSGITQYQHICKGMAIKLYSLTNTSYQDTGNKPCPICSAKEKGLKQKKKGCCEHKSKLVTVNENVKKHSVFSLSINFWGNAIPNKMLGTVFERISSIPEAGKSLHYFSYGIPIEGNPLYILHCVYRI